MGARCGKRLLWEPFCFWADAARKKLGIRTRPLMLAMRAVEPPRNRGGSRSDVGLVITLVNEGSDGVFLFREDGVLLAYQDSGLAVDGLSVRMGVF